MKFSKADAAFTLAMLAGIALLSGILYIHNRTRSTGSGEAIGKVFYKREVAMRKFSDRMVWDDVESGSPLYAQDAVMTGNYSDAELVLNNGLRLKLEANTLIELDMANEGLNLRLNGGGIKAIAGSAAPAMVTTTDGQAINISDASASIRMAGSQANVEVSAGKVEVTSSAGAKQTVSQNEILSAGKKSRVALSVTGLGEDTVIFVSGQTARLTLGCSEPGAELDYSLSSAMASPRTLRLAAGSTAMQLAPGDWYARCRKTDSISGLRHFRVVRAGEYHIYRPEARIEYTGNPAVRIAFKPPRGIGTTQLEISSDAAFATPEVKRIIHENDLSVSLSRAAKWYYRLTAVAEKNGTQIQVAPSLGSFVLAPASRRPQLAFANVVEPEYSLELVQSGKALVSYFGDEAYNFEIIKKGDSKPLAKGTTQGGRFQIPLNLPGGTYLLAFSSASEKATLAFRIRDKVTLALATPAPETVLYVTAEGATAQLPVRWSASEEATQFQLILAQDSELRQVLRKINVDQHDFRFTGLTPRVYFLKVLALVGGIPRAETATISVRVENRLAPAEALTPAKDQTIDATKAAKLRLSWQPVPGATAYEVRLMQVRRGALVEIEKRTTRTPVLDVRNLDKFKEGEIVWEVSARKTDRTGKILQSSEPTRSSVQLSFGAAPPPPEIVPIVSE